MLGEKNLVFACVQANNKVVLDLILMCTKLKSPCEPVTFPHSSNCYYQTVFISNP